MIYLLPTLTHLIFYAFVLRNSNTRWKVTFLTLIVGFSISFIPFYNLIPRGEGIAFTSGMQVYMIHFLLMLTLMLGFQYLILRIFEKMTLTKSVLLIVCYWIFQFILVGLFFYFGPQIMGES